MYLILLYLTLLYLINTLLYLINTLLYLTLLSNKHIPKSFASKDGRLDAEFPLRFQLSRPYSQPNKEERAVFVNNSTKIQN